MAWRDRFHRMFRERDFAAFQIAEAYAGWGDRNGAFEWLDIAFRQRDAGLQILKTTRSLEPLHSDARWQPLLRKMKLADDQLK